MKRGIIRNTPYEHVHCRYDNDSGSVYCTESHSLQSSFRMLVEILCKDQESLPQESRLAGLMLSDALNLHYTSHEGWILLELAKQKTKQKAPYFLVGKNRSDGSLHIFHFPSNIQMPMYKRIAFAHDVVPQLNKKFDNL